VVETCEGLTLFPQRGVPREDIRPGLRVTHHKGRTLIAYAVEEAARTVSILGIFYGGQYYEAALSADPGD
jgi:toxin ParE1/3/4